MLKRDEWLDLARKLDWELTYVSEKDAFPEVQSGRPWLPKPYAMAARRSLIQQTLGTAAAE